MEDDRATAIGNKQKIGKDRACGSGDMLVDCGQTRTNTHTDVLITILRSNKMGSDTTKINNIHSEVEVWLLASCTYCARQKIKNNEKESER